MSALTDLLTNIANAIRAKKGTTSPINAQNFASEIDSIEVGGFDLAKWKAENMSSLAYEFYNYKGTNLDDIIPQLDTGNVTDMKSMFYGCANLTSIPQLDTGNVTDVSNMFYGCTNLTSIPQLDVSKATNTRYMFQKCSSLITIPPIDIGSSTGTSSMFNGCTNLKTLPPLDTKNVEGSAIASMFASCSSLEEVPELDLSKCTDLGSMFSGCINLKKFALKNTQNVTKLSNLFSSCSSLEVIPNFDISGVIASTNTTAFSGTFNYCTNLKSMLLVGINKNFNISYSSRFERSDLVTILNNLGTVTSKTTLTIGSTNLAKLTDTDKAIATNKGWTLA
jgi:surface protein